MKTSTGAGAVAAGLMAIAFGGGTTQAQAAAEPGWYRDFEGCRIQVPPVRLVPHAASPGGYRAKLEVLPRGADKYSATDQFVIGLQRGADGKATPATLRFQLGFAEGTPKQGAKLRIDGVAVKSARADVTDGGMLYVEIAKPAPDLLARVAAARNASLEVAFADGGEISLEYDMPAFDAVDAALRSVDWRCPASAGGTASASPRADAVASARR